MKSNLVLHLKKEFYDMYKNGLKDVDYREFKPYWISRIPGKKNAVLLSGYNWDTVINADIKYVEILGFSSLPDYAKELYQNSKYKLFFVIHFKELNN